MTTALLPGAELVERGLAALARGEVTAEALLVSMAAPSLQALGIEVAAALPDPELQLYWLLAREHGDAAHGRYNALVRRIVSYQRAAACAR